jgi:hypothetical protein
MGWSLSPFRLCGKRFRAPIPHRSGKHSERREAARGGELNREFTCSSAAQGPDRRRRIADTVHRRVIKHVTVPESRVSGASVQEHAA